ncbi:MAG: DUF599 domain-containing protein [Pseudomonadota bacterium]
MTEFSISVVSGFTLWDSAALLLFVLVWVGLGVLTEHPPKSRPSTHVIMDKYRLDWMREMARRDVRIFDSQVANGLRQGTAFFASATLLAVGGGAAAITQAETVALITDDLAPELMVSRATLEAKILAVTLVFALAFMKFVWAHRLLGYTATVMAATPSCDHLEDALRVAEKAGKLSNTAVRSFNRGLRNIYFALALLAWMLGAVPLIIATLFAAMTVIRREFASQSRAALLD